jgi:transposase-like protein
MPKTGRTRYSLEDRERGLAALVIAGSSIRASEVTGIQASTLREWKMDHPERYEALRHDLEPQVARTIAAEAESLAQRIASLEHRTIDHIEATIDELKPSEAAGALRNLTTSKALNVDKVSSPLRERPSHVQHNTGVDELVSKLNRALGFDATSTAIELSSTPLKTERDELNA